MEDDQEVLLVGEGTVQYLHVLSESRRALQLALHAWSVLLLVQVPELHGL